jgi:hypothetical protein
MESELKKNPFKKKEYGEAYTMNANEKKISFLNRYFIYKKIRNINAEKVQIDMEEYDSNVSINSKNDMIKMDAKETKHAIEVAEKMEKKEIKKELKEKPKIKKINKKIVLVAGSNQNK